MRSQRRSAISAPPPVRKRKKAGGGKMESGSGRWMLTYLDMVTLLFGVFILLYAMSNVDKKKFEEVAASLKAGFGGGMTIYPHARIGGLIPADTEKYLPGTESELLKFVKNGLSDLRPEVQSRKITISEEERGLVVTIASDVFFAPGDARIDIESARRVLETIAYLLCSPVLAERTFRIEGHTDNLPPDTGRYESNWELSVLRSANVLHYLVDYGAPEARFQIAGTGEEVPLMSNDTEEGRSYNRRVDIVILKDANL